MSHFSELDNNNTVLRVIVVSNDELLDENDDEQEQIGVAFLKKLFGYETNWKQTSYNNNFRFRYASIGMKYDESLDAFIEPKPFDSWILNPIDASWDAPIPIPTLTEDQDDCYYSWNEIDYQSDNTTGWILKKLVNINSETPEDVDTETPEKYIWVDPPGRLELVT